MTVRLRTAERYATILEVNRAAITQPGLDEVFRGMYSAVKKVLPCDRAGLSLYDPEKAVLNLAACEGCSPGSFYTIGQNFDLDQSHHGSVFRLQKPIVRRDLVTDLQFQIEKYNVREGIRSYCAVPLVVRGKSIGVIIILSSQKNQYSAGHAEFLQDVSNQIVLAITSLRPFCAKHSQTKLICPRCIAASGGQVTAARYKEQLSRWGRQGGRGRKKKPAGGLKTGILG
jgi:formate hydrogenlyase transcriptional activator